MSHNYFEVLMEQLFQVDNTLVASYNIQQVLVPPSAEISILYGY